MLNLAGLMGHWICYESYSLSLSSNHILCSIYTVQKQLLNLFIWNLINVMIEYQTHKVRKLTYTTGKPRLNLTRNNFFLIFILFHFFSCFIRFRSLFPSHLFYLFITINWATCLFFKCYNFEHRAAFCVSTRELPGSEIEITY